MYFVAAVERELNGHSIYQRTASSSTTLYGRGVRSGYEISVPSTGGQWQGSFNQPRLSVQVVDVSQERAEARLEQIVALIATTAQKRQDESGVSAVNRIVTVTAPEKPGFAYITGSHRREQAALLLLGSIVSAAAASWSATSCERRRRVRGEPVIA
ncbi:hypothetical protein GCM10022236_38840 [Microlunatus ginsengisoli]|uniref:AcrB/AcrD/AcrF family protein n=1 Tax=Microlunatus ginsengisoli TaxID=363863 RepID=A0ABP7AHM8_9ACTN